MACHSEYTYIYTQCLFQLLARQENNTKGGGGAAVKYLSQVLRLAAEADGGQDTTTMTLALGSSDGSSYNPALVQAMFSMLSKKSLNPADITLLYRWFSQNETPAVQLIRDPVFIDLLIDALFGTKGAKLHSDHRPKYIFLLAYATSVAESSKKVLCIMKRCPDGLYALVMSKF